MLTSYIYELIITCSKCDFYNKYVFLNVQLFYKVKKIPGKHLSALQQSQYLNMC